MITPDQVQAIYALYPKVVTTHGDNAFDENGNKVAYDLDLVDAKVIETKDKQQAKVQAAQAKLAQLGLTPEDLKALLG